MFLCDLRYSVYTLHVFDLLRKELFPPKNKKADTFVGVFVAVTSGKTPIDERPENLEYAAMSKRSARPKDIPETEVCGGIDVIHTVQL